jgi:DNA-binding transcriptional MerR regulator
MKARRFTVKEIAKLSGVSARTLRFYDEIGLLKPAFYGENGYRYYEREQLLMLQQILFYRELDMPLENIKRVVSSPDFDKLEALLAHQRELRKDAKRLHRLIQTVERTIASLKGESKMKDEELYYGFDSEKQKEHERYLIKRYGKGMKKSIADSKKRFKKMGKVGEERLRIHNEDLKNAFPALIDAKVDPSDPRVQELMERHYQAICVFWTPTRETYKALGGGYLEHPGFRQFYDQFHPKLVDFLVKAMHVYADQRLD